MTIMYTNDYIQYTLIGLMLFLLTVIYCIKICRYCRETRDLSDENEYSRYDQPLPPPDRVPLSDEPIYTEMKGRPFMKTK